MSRNDSPDADYQNASEEADTCKDVDRLEFEARLRQLYEQRASNTHLLTPEKYVQVIQLMKGANSRKKTPTDYRHLKKYQVVSTPEGDRLFAAQKPGERRRQMFVTMDETYDIIREYHLKLNHGGRTRMMIDLKRKYRNVTTQSVLLYLSMCGLCKNKVIKRGKSGVNSGPSAGDSFVEFEYDDPLRDFEKTTSETEQEITSTPGVTMVKKYPELYSRGQVDILGVTNDSDEEFKFLLVYRNFITKFIHLKAMKAICVNEAVDALLEIYLVFGAPNILQSKNGKSVLKPICRRLTVLCPEIKVVRSDLTFTKNDFSGKSNEDILKRLNNWLAKTQHIKWQDGVKYIQYSLNTTFHEVMCKTPSELVFGVNPSMGIASFMHKSIYEDLLTENDLELAFNQKETSKPLKLLKLDESLVLPTTFIKEEESQDENDDDIEMDL